jgi:hypothetical protein
MAHLDRNHTDLPYVDKHEVRIAASRERVWAALYPYATALGFPESSPLARILGIDPPGGFTISESHPDEYLTLVGRHRFARYELGFEITEAASDATDLHAHTWAEFPGLRGRVYRALVISSGAHALATNHMLRTVRKRA